MDGIRDGDEGIIKDVAISRSDWRAFNKPKDLYECGRIRLIKPRIIYSKCDRNS